MSHMRFGNRFLGAVCALVTLIGVTVTAQAADSSNYYEIEDIPIPKKVDGETGGLAFLPDGRLAACFHRGDIYFYDPDSQQWRQFAEGLHEPLGLVALSNQALLVMQRPELTRVEDTDGDGWADRYVTLCDDFGMSGNYHEFGYGPAVGPQGNYYISLNTASNGAGIYDEIRGEFRERGRPGRMYSCVPYRGWVLKISPDGRMTPWAMGFRSPNGIGFDSEGRLFVSDNQGDWVGTSKLFHVERGRFYGHVSSLVWKEGFKGNPLKRPVKELDAMRTKPAFLFPHGKFANSPTQPIPTDESADLGPFAGQLLIGEMNHPRIIRLMQDEVAGKVQGAATSLYEGGKLKRGNNRLTFGSNGDLWIAHTARHSGWAGDRGIQRLSWTGKVPMDLLEIHLTEDGFDLTFTKPLDPEIAKDTSHYDVSHYYYEYHRSYGSARHDEQSVAVTGIELSSDYKTASLSLDTLKAGYVYELNLGKLSAQDGTEMLNDQVYYTLSRLTDGSSATPQFAPEPPLQFHALDQGQAEAENATTIQVANRASNNSGYTGEGYVDFQSADQDLLEWVIDDVPGGHYQLQFRYAIAANPRPLRLRVNGNVLRKSFVLPSTGSWETWKMKSVEVSLPSGSNTVRLEAIGQSGPNIDHLRLNKVSD